MKKHCLEQAYELVRSAGLANGESDFSEEWLGYNESYLRSLRFKNAEPSLGAIAICSLRLMRAGEQMISSSRYRTLGTKFLLEGEQLRELVNEGGVELDLRGHNEKLLQ